VDGELLPEDRTVTQAEPPLRRGAQAFGHASIPLLATDNSIRLRCLLANANSRFYTLRESVVLIT
ncbi:hypothetical protein, partial [Cypionkella sp.]|uniref:hypothetical protein n=1 Tax=Cypionkella sp. TaxID=2811411 RepID=UPI002ABCED4D